jgi:hypothetical protein
MKKIEKVAIAIVQAQDTIIQQYTLQEPEPEAKQDLLDASRSFMDVDETLKLSTFN